MPKIPKVVIAIAALTVQGCVAREAVSISIPITAQQTETWTLPEFAARVTSDEELLKRASESKGDTVYLPSPFMLFGRDELNDMSRFQKPGDRVIQYADFGYSTVTYFLCLSRNGKPVRVFKRGPFSNRAQA